MEATEGISEGNNIVKMTTEQGYIISSAGV